MKPTVTSLSHGGQRSLTLTGKFILNVAEWWKIYRVIKAFYIVFICVLIYLHDTGMLFGLSVLELAMPWWSFIALVGAVILVLEDGRSVWIYLGGLLPMFLYALALVYGLARGGFPLISVLPIVYLSFGCLGFVSGIYGTWRVRSLINRVVNLERNLVQLEEEVNRYATGE